MLVVLVSDSWILQTQNETGCRAYVLPPMNGLMQVSRKGLESLGVNVIDRLDASYNPVHQRMDPRAEPQDELLRAVKTMDIQRRSKSGGSQDVRVGFKEIQIYVNVVEHLVPRMARMKRSSEALLLFTCAELALA
jgi:hypothetical protein